MDEWVGGRRVVGWMLQTDYLSKTLKFITQLVKLFLTSIVLTSHKVEGMVKRQRMRSEVARVPMKTFLAVLIDSRPRTAHRIRVLPNTPTMMKRTYIATCEKFNNLFFFLKLLGIQLIPQVIQTPFCHYHHLFKL